MKHKVLCYALALSIGSILVGCNSNESSEIKSTTTTASSITTISTTTKIITSTAINTTKISTKLSTTSTTSATQSTTTVVNYTENNTPGAMLDVILRLVRTLKYPLVDSQAIYRLLQYSSKKLILHV